MVLLLPFPVVLYHFLTYINYVSCNYVFGANFNTELLYTYICCNSVIFNS